MKPRRGGSSRNLKQKPLTGWPRSPAWRLLAGLPGLGFSVGFRVFGFSFGFRVWGLGLGGLGLGFRV